VQIVDSSITNFTHMKCYSRCCYKNISKDKKLKGQ
jgi:hypothetical protein